MPGCAPASAHGNSLFDGVQLIMKTKTFTIVELEALPVRGNHMQDSGLFNACHDFIVDEKNAMADRIRALQIIDRAMGLGTADRVDAPAVLAYIQETEG